MRTTFSIFCLAAVFSLNLFSQYNSYSIFSVNSAKTGNLSNEIRTAVDEAKVIDVDFSSVKQIVNRKSERISVQVPLNGSMLNVELNRFEILAPGAKIVGGTQNGDRVIDMNNSFVVYTSELRDKNTPLVVMTFFEDEVSALISTSSEVSVLARLEGNNINSDYIFYNSSKMKLRSTFNCGTDGLEIPEQIMNMQNDLRGSINDLATSQLLKANIAIETDFETFNYFGGTLGATRYILRLLGPVSALYVRDINVQLQSTYLRVWETSADPYNGTTSNTLLNEFRNYWNGNMQSVPRTLAHYITTRPGGLGGIAWVNVLCANPANGYGYAFSDIDGTFNVLPTYSWDAMVVAHETGHNFGSPHTHSCSWPGGPIDSCYAVEGGCYTGPAIPRVGTIMSYCHLNGSIALNFGQLPSELIRTRAENASCLTNITGFLVATPNGGEILRNGGQNSVIIWGTDYVGNVNVEYSVNNGANWSTVQNNVTSTLRTVSWTVPYIPTTTQAKVRVYQIGNENNGDQSDSVFQIRPFLNQFLLVDPPQLYSTTVSAGDTSRLHFIFTRSGTLPEIKYKWILSTTNGSNVYSPLSNNNGSDSVFSITRGKIDSIISTWGAINVGDSIRLRWNVRANSMLDSVQTSNFLITFRRGVIGIQNISSQIPKEFFVKQNYPNPFNPVTKIRFGLPKSAYVNIRVFDILGKEVAVLANEELKAGEFEVDWNALNFPSGIYFYRINAGEYVKTSKMMLVK
jgi:Metallo-peptidase family M12/Secretion system C-terminal sorting domain